MSTTSEGFQKPENDPGQWRKMTSPPLIRVLPGKATCACGWTHTAPRHKVLEKAAARHLERRHNGTGFWL